MVFSSIFFIFFFLPVVLVLHAVCPRAWRNGLLFLVSILFYAWGEGFYTAVMLATIVLNWGLGLMVERCGSARARDWGVTAALAANLGMLAWFKYGNFAFENLAAIGLRIGPADPIHLPIGISFFTFQAISYVIDIARGEVRAQRSLLDYAFYKAFFPQLIAGPIVRYRDVCRDISERTIGSELFLSGVGRFCLGLVKKVLVANTLAVPADRIFALAGDQLSTSAAWLGLVCYALQIYFDFSGYSDMAIGLGRMFGFRFLENFDHPYVATSVQGFWRRWHISLSTWFRDYLYFPLGGSRCSRLRTACNLLLVFLLCGFWHGAAWNFMVWGAWHGGFLALEHFSLIRPAGWWLPLRHGYTLLAVAVGWVLFRADSLPHAGQLLTILGGAGGQEGVSALAFLNREVLTFLVVGVVCATPWPARLAESWLARIESGQGLLRQGALSLAQLAGIAMVLLLACAYLLNQSSNPFIYFRF